MTRRALVPFSEVPVGLTFVDEVNHYLLTKVVSEQTEHHMAESRYNDEYFFFPDEEVLITLND